MKIVNFYVKTQAFNSDNRVLKELESISKKVDKIRIFLSSNDIVDCNKYPYDIVKIKLIGGSAPKNILLRLLGALQFTVICTFLSYKMKKRSNITAWICDPILFPLVYCASFIGMKTVWDHHELPPEWTLKSRFTKFLFRKTYKKATFLVHANFERMVYLEKKINVLANDYLILKNIPTKKSILDEMKCSQSIDWLNGRKFVYLQNSLIENRNGVEIARAIIDSGYVIVHAGNSVDTNYLNMLGDNYIKKCLLLGSLGLDSINYLLSCCEFTVISYKSNSLNQMYCEPNRIYQAMARNTFIIAGNNPTIVDILKGYPNKILLPDDGSEYKSVLNAISLYSSDSKASYEYNDFWENYDVDFERLLSND
ncbi:hypothetical protein H5183_20805 [Pseudoalteromonas sp. SR44-8]|uniref:hypothetical protein n=1 Tax=Pseudoalteromonas sp. SR44-8 TaxID=2760933 RepID=UPI001601310F|nr:hypothetical protein [Pseudoalteromonas sp. SR44-8]MBB1303744.1 hypothetical protein [Pseudoalteromonas sp. SR44-8]